MADDEVKKTGGQVDGRLYTAVLDFRSQLDVF